MNDERQSEDGRRGFFRKAVGVAGAWPFASFAAPSEVAAASAACPPATSVSPPQGYLSLGRDEAAFVEAW